MTGRAARTGPSTASWHHAGAGGHHRRGRTLRLHREPVLHLPREDRRGGPGREERLDHGGARATGHPPAAAVRLLEEDCWVRDTPLKETMKSRGPSKPYQEGRPREFYR